MAPRDFSELNSAGAGNSLSSAPAPGTGASPGGLGGLGYGTWGADAGSSRTDGGTDMSGVNGNTQDGQLNSFGKEIGSDMTYDDWMKYGGGNMGIAPSVTGGSSSTSTPPPTNTSTGQPFASQPSSLGAQDTTGITPWGRQFTQNTGGPNINFGGFYAEGGAIPEEDDPSQGQDNGLAAMVAKSLTSVQEVLAYGRQKHGLGNSNSGAIKEGDEQQVAARMPSVPGSPSESGVKPPQPMPGPLPPTSNPFGKRAEAEPEDDGAGAIDTDEEMA